MLLCLAFGSCKTSRTTITVATPPVEKSIDQLIQAENTGDFITLEKLYAADYRSLSPVYKGTKSELLAILKKSHQQNPSTVKAKILDTNTGSAIATANLFWSIYDTSGTLLYARPLLQIWVFRDKRWQLQRTLFYDAEEVPEFEEN